MRDLLNREMRIPSINRFGAFEKADNFFGDPVKILLFDSKLFPSGDSKNYDIRDFEFAVYAEKYLK